MPETEMARAAGAEEPTGAAAGSDAATLPEGSAGPDRLRRWAPGVLAALLFCLYSAYAIARHRNLYTAGFDLGIFDQAVRAYAAFEAPIVPIKGPGFNLLGDHFHPIIALLAPLYWVWPDPVTLLVAQAALIAVSVVPITRYALRRLGTGTGLIMSAMYGLSWGVHGAIGFDFHEIAFAVPMLAFAMVALAEHRWTAAAAWTLPLIFVKEDMGLTVAAVGAYLWWRGSRRTGALLVVIGLVAVAFTVKVFLPYFNTNGFSYSAFVEGGPVRALTGLPLGFGEHPGKAMPIIMVLIITCGATLRSPLTLLVIPGLLPRLISDNPFHWSIGGVHYNAPLMPILFVATISALPAFAASRSRFVRRYGRAVVWVTAVFTLLPPMVIWNGMLVPQTYRLERHAVAAGRVLSMIPDGAAVAASNRLAPHLVDRTGVVLFPSRGDERVDWVVVDTVYWAKEGASSASKRGRELIEARERRAELGLDSPSARQQSAALRTLGGRGFVQVASEDGVLLFRRTR
ncbi:DUF2079 domain-containing protein [Actinomadura viridis]